MASSIPYGLDEKQFTALETMRSHFYGLDGVGMALNDFTYLRYLRARYFLADSLQLVIVEIINHNNIAIINCILSHNCYQKFSSGQVGPNAPRDLGVAKGL